MSKKTWFAKLILFVKLLILLIGVIVFCFVIVMPQYTYNYQASLIDKVERLDSIKEPKIVLVGNSNLPFGMKSELLEEAIGMPVVNMGLHGGTGNVFNERAAEVSVEEGDIVIICHSNYGDLEEIKNPELAWITIENHLNLWKFIPINDIPDMARAYPTYLKKCITMWSNGTGNLDTDPLYSRSQFNEYGDISYKRPVSEDNIDFTPVVIPSIGDSTVKRLNELNERLTEKGATMLVAAYPIAHWEKAPPVEEYKKFGQELAKKLDCPVISDYTDYCFEPSDFFNTYLHMTDDGAVKRTEQLIEDIENYLGIDAKEE